MMLLHDCMSAYIRCLRYNGLLGAVCTFSDPCGVQVWFTYRKQTEQM